MFGFLSGKRKRLQANSLSRCKPLLGTYVEISLIAEDDDLDLIALSEAAFSEIEAVHRLMSFHEVDSELSNINREAHLRPCTISPQTEEVLRQSLELSCASDGVFDVTVAPHLIKQGLLPQQGLPSHLEGTWEDIRLENGQISFDKPLLIDLGGIAKGYAVDRAISVFPVGVKAVVNAGGDLRMTHWKDEQVSVRRPSTQQQGAFSLLPMQEAAIATSGSNFLEGRGAIVLPKAGEPFTSAESISIFAPNCMLADALTKIASLDRACGPLLRSFGAQAVVLDAKGEAARLQ